MMLNIDRIKPGMTLATSIFNKNGITILNSGKELTESIIRALKNNGIYNVDVELTKEQEEFYQLDNDIYTTISRELKNKAMYSLKKLDINGILESVQEIITAILTSKEFSYSLIEYKNENSIFAHSVRVAAFSAVLAKYYNDSLENLDNETKKKETINIQSLVTAALLHDLGETYQDKEININFSKIPEAFSKKFPGIKKVPLNGYSNKYKSLYTFCLLNEFMDFGAETKLITLLVNENELGTGPLETPKEFINSKQNFIVASKIIRLCSIYDNLLRKSIKQNESLENISSALEIYSTNGILNKELTDLFLNHIPLYSVGVKVKLSDDRYARVIETFTEKVNNYKPIVEVIPTREIVDLRAHTNLTVKEICGNEISFAEIVARQIIDMNNQNTILEEHRKVI